VNRQKMLKVLSCKARAIGVDCLNPNPQWWKRTLIATASKSGAAGSASFEFLDA